MPGERPGLSAARAAAEAGGLVAEGRPLLVLLSGGADSVCLLHVALGLGAAAEALHVNYGLRPEAENDEAFCRGLCSDLGVTIHVERAWLPEQGNLHAHAREARYAAAERLTRGDYAAAHTASDQAETVLYRLASSPGRRALLGMEPRRGRLVRPLLEVTREQTREHCRAAGLGWREDASNDDPRFARARVRNRLLAALREVAPNAERTIADTAAQLRDEAAVLDAEVATALEGLGGGPAVALADLRGLGPALARLALRALAEKAAGGPVALGSARAGEVLALGAGGSHALDLGGGLRAVSEYGTVRFVLGGDAPAPEPVVLAVPGRVRFGGWEVEARAGGGGEAEVSAAALGATALVRAWREGDRMRPAGLGGSKSLADLFTDAKVPRALRRSLPLLEAHGEIAWVAGVALGERFVAAGGEERVGLTARRPSE